MTAQRSRKEELTYKRYQQDRKLSGKHDECVFCNAEKNDERLIEEIKHFIVIENIFPYSVWDSQKVDDHLMIVPKKHTDKLGDLPEEAAIEYLKLVDKYEDAGYNIYARAPGSGIKSVVHQHTHLIKPTGSRRNFVLFLRKPFIRISF